MPSAHFVCHYNGKVEHYRAKIIRLFIMEILDTFLMPSAWIALLTLIFLEIVLGVDNVVFLLIMTSRLPEKTA